MNKSITQMNGINCKHKKKSEWKKKNIDKKKKVRPKKASPQVLL